MGALAVILGHFRAIFVAWRSQKSQILSALIRTGLRQPKLRRCITWLTPFVKKVRTLPLRALWPSQAGKHTTLAQPWNTFFFHLALLRHQNIKTSLNFLEENHWSRPFFALFRSVREKLQLTVSLNQLNFQNFKYNIQNLIQHLNLQIWQNCTAASWVGQEYYGSSR